MLMEMELDSGVSAGKRKDPAHFGFRDAPAGRAEGDVGIDDHAPSVHGSVLAASNGWLRFAGGSDSFRRNEWLNRKNFSIMMS